MKILLVFPGMYSLDKTLKQGFEENDCSVDTYDYRNHTKGFYEKIENKKLKLSYGWRNKWEQFYFKTINEAHIKNFEKVNPDVVLIYNNEMLLPETVKMFKQTAKVFFFLGDSPFYTHTSKYNLQLLFLADGILVPDTGWIAQLKMLGLQNLHHFIPATTDNSNAEIKPTKEDLEKWGSDMAFIGGNVNHSWGYKRALYLNQFSGLDFKLYGPSSWYKWSEIFPDLKNCIVPHGNGRLSFEDVNTIMSCTKVYPVDANPGLLNGIHLRTFECIEAGVLPLVEYRKDINIVFEGIELPVIYSYNKAEAIARKYIGNDQKREKTLKTLQEYLTAHYNPKVVISRVLQKF